MYPTAGPIRVKAEAVLVAASQSIVINSTHTLLVQISVHLLLNHITPALVHKERANN